MAKGLAVTSTLLYLEAIALAHTYEVRIRMNGYVTTTQVQASSAGLAKKLIVAQFGPSVSVLSVKKAS